MLFVVNFNKFTIILLFIIFLCLTVFAIRFQNKQKRKYMECLKLIKEKETSIQDELSNAQIKKNSGTVDINKLMMKLYDIYLKFIENLNKNNKDFSNLLDGFIREFYENKIDIYQKKEYFEVTDDIELVNYSILEYDEKKLKFRINITCFNYKMNKQRIMSGSNFERVNQIFIVTYEKKNKKWLIVNIEKVFEKKMSI